MKNVEEKAINTLLNKGVRFKIRIRVLGIVLNIPFNIKPLHLGTILYLSKQRLKLQDVSDEKETIWELFDKAENVKIFAKCIAIAVLNSPFKIMFFTLPLYYLFLWKLTIKDISDSMIVVINQMNARDFFLITALIKGIKIIDRTNTSPKKQSGELSEKSQKN
jgi:hypothetical protein